jgi:hypothetical protein
MLGAIVITGYTTVFTDLTTALGTAATAVILPAVLVIAGGLFAIRLGWGVAKRFVK